MFDGLQIPMHDAAGVGRADRGHDRQERSRQLAHGQRAARQPGSERLALEQLHDHRRPVRALDEIEDLDHVRMVHGAGALGLAGEARSRLSEMAFVRPTRELLHRDGPAREQCRAAHTSPMPPSPSSAISRYIRSASTVPAKRAHAIMVADIGRGDAQNHRAGEPRSEPE